MTPTRPSGRTVYALASTSTQPSERLRQARWDQAVALAMISRGHWPRAVLRRVSSPRGGAFSRMPAQKGLLQYLAVAVGCLFFSVTLERQISSGMRLCAWFPRYSSCCPRATSGEHSKNLGGIAYSVNIPLLPEDSRREKAPGVGYGTGAYLGRDARSVRFWRCSPGTIV
jgi:hypothetical protein